jgi:hypothetical protein
MPEWPDDEEQVYDLVSWGLPGREKRKKRRVTVGLAKVACNCESLGPPLR